MARYSKTAVGAVAFLTTVGGGIWYLGKPPFANEQQVQSQFQQYEKRLDQVRLNEVDAQIVKIERDGQTRRLSPIEADLLRRLYTERQQLLCQLRIVKCG